MILILLLIFLDDTRSPKINERDQDRKQERITDASALSHADFSAY